MVYRTVGGCENQRAIVQALQSRLSELQRRTGSVQIYNVAQHSILDFSPHGEDRTLAFEGDRTMT